MRRTASASSHLRVTIALVVVGSALAGVLATIVAVWSVPTVGPHSPEEAARTALRALHERDFPRYAAVALNRAEVLRADVGGEGGAGSYLDDVMRPEEEARLRAEFDALVRQGLADLASDDGIAASAVAQRDGQWRVELYDRDGVPLGIDVLVSNFEGSYKVSAMRTARAPIQ